jgi:hypothetical protein
MKPITLTETQKELFKTKGGGILISEKRIGHVGENFSIDDRNFKITSDNRCQIYLLTKDHAVAAGYDTLDTLTTTLENAFKDYHRNMDITMSCTDTVYLQYFSEDI